jgi:hypothetical protein
MDREIAHFPKFLFDDYEKVSLIHEDQVKARFRIIVYEGRGPVGVAIVTINKANAAEIDAWMRPQGLGWEPRARGPWSFRRTHFDSASNWLQSIASLTRDPMPIITDPKKEDDGHNTAVPNLPIRILVELEVKVRDGWFYSWAMRNSAMFEDGPGKGDVDFLNLIVEHNWQ